MKSPHVRARGQAEAQPITLSLQDIEGTTGGNTIPLVDRLVEIHGLANVPASAAAINGTVVPPETSFVYDPEMPVAAGRIQLVVPEPGTLALLGGALTAFSAARRRRVRKAG